MDEKFFRLGGERVTSATHTMVASSDAETRAAAVLADRLREKYGRAPMACPEAVWLRSVALHGGAAAAEQSRARTPIWFVASLPPNAQMLSALQLSVEELALGESRCVILAHRYRQFNKLEGVGEVELSDVALVVVGDLDAAVAHLMAQVLTDANDGILEGFVLHVAK